MPRSRRTGDGQGALLKLVRGRGARCGFCGRPATVVALVAGGGSEQAAICPSCVARLAAGLGGPGDGGSAA